MIKAPISLQDLRRRLYVKAKTERSGRHRCLGFGWKRWSREWLYERSGSFRSLVSPPGSYYSAVAPV